MSAGLLDDFYMHSVGVMCLDDQIFVLTGVPNKVAFEIICIGFAHLLGDNGGHGDLQELLLDWNEGQEAGVEEA